MQILTLSNRSQHPTLLRPVNHSTDPEGHLVHISVTSAASGSIGMRMSGSETQQRKVSSQKHLGTELKQLPHLVRSADQESETFFLRPHKFQITHSSCEGSIKMY